MPGEDHAVEEPGHPQVGQGQVTGFGLVHRQPAGQRLAQRAGDVLGHPVRQDLPGPGEQARARHAGRVGLEQGEPGQVDVRPAGRVAEGRADVLDAEVGQLAVGVPDGPDHEHRLGQAVEQGVDRLLGVRGGQVAVRQPGRDHPGAAGRQRGQVLADLGGEGHGSRPADLHHAKQLTAALAQREHGAGAVRDPGHRGRVGVLAAFAPPQVGGAVGDPLGRAVQLRRDVPPAAGLAAGQALLAEQHERPVGLEEPDHHRGRAERVHDLRGQGAGQLGAVGGQFGGRLGEQRRRDLAAAGLRARAAPGRECRCLVRPGPRRPSRPAGSRSPRTARRAAPRPRPRTGRAAPSARPWPSRRRTPRRPRRGCGPARGAGGR